VEQNPLEFPEQMRELANKNVEQATAAYSQFNDAMTSAMETWFSAIPTNEATTGVKPLQEKAVSFANQNAEAGLAHAKELANAKDMQEVMAIQTRFAQSQMQNYTKQVQELGQVVMSAVPKSK
jgi:phasin